MTRVLRPEGTVTIATWAGIDESPGYAAMRDLLGRQLGADAAAALDAPFALGAGDTLRALTAPVLGTVDIVRVEGEAVFGSMQDWVHTEIRGWTLADAIDDDEFHELLDAAHRDLGEFVDANGRVRFRAPALIATATPGP